MNKILFAINVILFGTIVVLFTFIRPAVAKNEASPLESTPKAYAQALAARDSEESERAAKARIEERLREVYLQKFLESFENPDPNRRFLQYAAKEKTYSDYSELLAHLRLSPGRTARLADLLSRRRTSFEFPTNLPIDLVDSGLPKTLHFGAADIELVIQKEFGGRVLAEIKEYDSSLPSVNERKDIAEILSSIPGALDGEKQQKLESLLKDYPPPVKPEKAESESMIADYYKQRLERVERILDFVSKELGQDSHTLLKEYLLRKEEASIDLNLLLNSKKSSPKT